jgi:hypothetical protein
MTALADPAYCQASADVSESAAGLFDGLSSQANVEASK